MTRADRILLVVAVVLAIVDSVLLVILFSRSMA